MTILEMGTKSEMLERLNRLFSKIARKNTGVNVSMVNESDERLDKAEMEQQQLLLMTLEQGQQRPPIEVPEPIEVRDSKCIIFLKYMK